jgi:hypothetical protein
LFPADDRIVNQMAEKSKKYLITAESHEILIFRRNKEKAVRRFCAECKTEVEMLTLDAITTETKTPTRELFRLIEKNLLHSFETENGHLLVCRNSLEI